MATGDPCKLGQNPFIKTYQYCFRYLPVSSQKTITFFPLVIHLRLVVDSRTIRSGTSFR
jgi:hypothetical protein